MTTDSGAPVLLDVSERIATITLNRPAARNALSSEVLALLPKLMHDADSRGDVDVLGLFNYLDVWNHERLVTKMQREPFTEEDARTLSEFGI